MSNIKRKLVTIRTITNLEAITKRDRIVLAQVDGWKSVVQKDAFNVGDLVVYFEKDAILPHSDVRYHSIMGKQTPANKTTGDVLENGDDECIFGWVVSGMKFGDGSNRVYSMGLILPISMFDELQGVVLTDGMDITDLLSIKQNKECKNPDAIGDLPPFLRETTAGERIQNCLGEIDFNSDERWHVSLKVDGTSAMFYARDGKFGICSKEQEYPLIPKGKPTVYHIIAEKYKIFEKMIVNPNNCIAICCEIYGNGINGNPENIEDVEAVAFDIFDISTGTRNMYFYKDGFSIKSVPEFAHNATFKDIGINNLEGLLAYADNAKSLTGKQAEGVVFKSLDRDFRFKVISNKYLTK